MIIYRIARIEYLIIFEKTNQPCKCDISISLKLICKIVFHTLNPALFMSFANPVYLEATRSIASQVCSG